MAHNIIVIITSTIPDSVILLNSQFNGGTFNKDRTRRQIDGYAVDENEEYILPKQLCHDENYLFYLCRGEPDPVATVQTILDSSYEIKSSEYKVMRNDPLSEWYKPQVELI